MLYQCHFLLAVNFILVQIYLDRIAWLRRQILSKYLVYLTYVVLFSSQVMLYFYEYDIDLVLREIGLLHGQKLDDIYADAILAQQHATNS